MLRLQRTPRRALAAEKDNGNAACLAPLVGADVGAERPLRGARARVEDARTHGRRAVTDAIVK